MDPGRQLRVSDTCTVHLCQGGHTHEQMHAPPTATCRSTNRPVMPSARPGRWMTLCYPVCLFILLFNSPGGGVAYAQRQPPTGLETKNVLILHSHEANAPVFLGTDRGLVRTLESGGIPRLNQIYESLELRRYPFPEHRRLLVEQMRLRYSQRKFDMIVTMYPEALEFVLNDGRDIFSDIPILALHLPQSFELPKTDRRIIGHSVTFNIIGTFEIALKPRSRSQTRLCRERSPPGRQDD